MKIENNTIYTQRRFNKNNINFNGKIPYFAIPTPKIISSSEKFEHTYRHIADLVGVDDNVIKTAVKGVSSKRLSLLKVMAGRYNSKYFYAPQELKENPQTLMDIFNSVKRPSSDHFFIMSYVHGSFEHLKNILNLVDSKKDMALIKKLQKEIIQRDKSATTLITDMLSSRHKKEYAKNFSDYKPYLKLNIKDKDAVKKLDTLVDKGLYDANEAAIDYEVKSILSRVSSSDAKFLNADNIKKYYSPEGAEVLETTLSDYLLFRKDVSIQEIEKDILSIYKTTTKKNVDLRLDVLEKLKYTSPTKNSNKTEKEEVKEIRTLFDRIDANKHVRNFVKKALLSKLDTNTAGEINEILEATSPKEADVYFENIKRIVNRTSKDERISEMLKGLKNPLYDTPKMAMRKRLAKEYGYMEKTETSPFIRIMRHLKSKVIDTLTPKSKETWELELSKDLDDLIENTPKKVIPDKIITPSTDMAPTKAIEEIAQKSEIEAISTITEPLNAIENSTSETLTKVITSSENTQSPALILTNLAKEAKKAKKLKVINDVNDIINKKLGVRQLEKQHDEYTKKATAMRLKLLPEIFDSIKETRITDKQVGKIKHNSSSNDAVTLYTAINGKNRKLVKYMLQKRNADKTRMFEVKDIITFLEKANKQIRKQKSINSSYKAADEKAYYNHLYDSFLQQYGKPTIIRKTAPKGIKKTSAHKSNKVA